MSLFLSFLAEKVLRARKTQTTNVGQALLHHTWYACSNIDLQQNSLIITARKRRLRRLCFHRCLSVHGGGGRAWRGGVRGRGRAWQGACMAGGVHGGGQIDLNCEH